jgi:hypothetical protein
MGNSNRGGGGGRDRTEEGIDGCVDEDSEKKSKYTKRYNWEEGMRSVEIVDVGLGCLYAKKAQFGLVCEAAKHAVTRRHSE